MQITGLTPAQSQIAKDLHRYRVVCAGRRFGKSTLAAFELIGKACAKGGNDCAYIAPTYAQARDIMWTTLKALASPITVSANESRLEIIVKTKGASTSRISLRGWESIETLRGIKLAFVVVDEVAMMRKWDTNWQEIIRPTLTDLRGEALFISTPKGYNHFYDLFGFWMARS